VRNQMKKIIKKLTIKKKIMNLELIKNVVERRKLLLMIPYLLNQDEELKIVITEKSTEGRRKSILLNLSTQLTKWNKK